MKLNLTLLWATISFVAVGTIVLVLQPYLDFH